jgi:purine-binding chemotaxis protein CheW
MKVNKINDVLRHIQDGGEISVHELDQLITLIEPCQPPHERQDGEKESGVKPSALQATRQTMEKNLLEPVQTKQILVKEEGKHKLESNVLVIEFLLGSQHFAVDLFKTKEIINVPEITPVPDTPRAVLGIFNLRGVITKILDLRTLIHIPPEDSRRAHIIVLDFAYSKEPLGLLVDNVLSVVSYSRDIITFDNAGEKESNRLGVIRRIKKEENRENAELTILLNLDYILNT